MTKCQSSPPTYYIVIYRTIHILTNHLTCLKNHVTNKKYTGMDYRNFPLYQFLNNISIQKWKVIPYIIIFFSIYVCMYNNRELAINFLLMFYCATSVTYFELITSFSILDSYDLHFSYCATQPTSVTYPLLLFFWLFFSPLFCILHFVW